MRPELDELLCKNYPKIFANRNGDIRTTAMCWGFECGDGWYDIINALCHNIQEHIDWKISSRERLLQNNPHNLKVPDEVEQVVAAQVKEKFGTLRFYTDGGDDYTHGLISMAESMSAVTCEDCGNKGHIRHGGWIRTLCDVHAEERGYGEANDGME
jgi:hypothetical protein